MFKTIRHDSIDSAPVIARDTVIVGSAIADNRRVEAPPGTVRAFDARTGRPRWSFDPLIHDGVVAGHANVWAPMSADEERGLVFLPTSSPSPDFWGGKRPGNNEHANSVVALRVETGELVWKGGHYGHGQILLVDDLILVESERPGDISLYPKRMSKR